MATLYPRKREMEMKYLRLAQSAQAAFRISTTDDGTFLQLKDSATDQFRTLWLNNGVPQAGDAES